MFENLSGSDLIRAFAIAAGVLGVGRRVGRGIRLVVGLGGAGGASLGGDEVLILAEDLVHGVDEGVDGLGRLEHGIGVDPLDDEVEGLVGRLSGLGGIGLHAGGILVGASDVESLVGIVQGFQLGDVGVEAEGLEGFRHVGLGEVEQQAVDQGGAGCRRRYPYMSPRRRPWRRSCRRPSARCPPAGRGLAGSRRGIPYRSRSWNR